MTLSTTNVRFKIQTSKIFFFWNFYYLKQNNNKLQDIPEQWILPGVTSFIKDNERNIYIFGARNDNNIYKYNNKINLFEKINKFKNNIQIDRNTVITYNNNNIFYTLSCGGFNDENQHLEIYNHSLNKWMNNIKYNKKNYYIYHGAKSELININNKSYIIISCENENEEDYFYIFDILLILKRNQLKVF